MGSRPSCVSLDLDDTVFLERDYVRSGFRYVGAIVADAYGVTEFEATAWRLFEDGVRGTIFDKALGACGLEPAPDLISDLVAAYRSHRPRIALLFDAATCITRLRAAGVLIAVVTDGPIESQRAKSAAVDAAAWADPVVLTAELGPGFAKPSPEAFRTVEAATGCAGRTCAYVADNPAKDFAGPKALGWRTVRVRRAGSLHEGVPSGPDVDHEVLDLATLPEHLGVAVAKGPTAYR